MFKKIFNYVILLGLLYLVFMHNNEKFTQTKKPTKKNKKTKAKKIEENNTDVNSLIDSVMEEELFSKPITEEEAREGMEKNESGIVNRFYKMFGSDDEEEEEMVQEEYNNDTNVDEYIDESIQETAEYVEETVEETVEEESEEAPRVKPKRDNSCKAFPDVGKFKHRQSGKKGRKEDMNIYKPKSSRLRKLQKVDKSMPKSIKQVFEEKIVDFKKQNKMTKKQKDRIQGCFAMENNQSNKFSKFEEDSESPYDMDINANDVHFENYSLI